MLARLTSPGSTTHFLRSDQRPISTTGTVSLTSLVSPALVRMMIVVSHRHQGRQMRTAIAHLTRTLEKAIS